MDAHVNTPNPTSPATSAPVVVIGAGPYGLAISAHLRGHGVAVRTFGEPMSSWRQNMPKGMFLKSEPTASSMSAPKAGYQLEDYCRLTGVPVLRDDRDVVSIDLFMNYGDWFQEQLVPVEREQVVRVAANGTGFAVTLASGETVNTPTVVVASGHVRYTYTPPALAALANGEPLPTPLVSHTSQHDDLSKFAGSEIAIIGAGQSALESAALLHEAGAGVHVLVRESEVLWAGPPKLGGPNVFEKMLKPPTGLGPGWSHLTVFRGAALVRHLPAQTRLMLVKRILGPAGAWWLRERFDGKVDVRTNCTVAAATAQGDKAVLETVGAHGGREQLVVDHVLAATGYRVDVDAIDFLDPGLRARVDRVPASGFPALAGSFESSVPGLFFAGLSAAGTFGPLLRFVCGTDFAAPRLAAAVAARR
jgi:thioredoxin reductase